MEPDLIQAVKQVCWDGALKKFIDYTCVYIKIQKHLDNIYIYMNVFFQDWIHPFWGHQDGHHE